MEKNSNVDELKNIPLSNTRKNETFSLQYACGGRGRDS
jgi:hypothetical protein